MSNLLSGPNAMSPWIGEAVAERVQGAPTSSSLWQVSGPRLAQVIAHDGDDDHDHDYTLLHLSDGQVKIVALVPKGIFLKLKEQDFSVGCLVRLTDWTVGTHHQKLWRRQQTQNDAASTATTNGDSLRLYVTGEMTIVGGRGLATIAAKSLKEVHQFLAVRRLLSALHWQWPVIQQRFERQHQQDPAGTETQSNSNPANAAAAAQTATNNDPNTGGKSATLPMGNLAALLGVQQNDSNSNAANTVGAIPDNITTTDQVQDLFGRVLAEADRQKQLEKAQEHQDDQEHSLEPSSQKEKSSDKDSHNGDDDEAMGIAAMLEPLVESEDDEHHYNKNNNRKSQQSKDTVTQESYTSISPRKYNAREPAAEQGTTTSNNAEPAREELSPDTTEDVFETQPPPLPPLPQPVPLNVSLEKDNDDEGRVLCDKQKDPLVQAASRVQSISVSAEDATATYDLFTQPEYPFSRETLLSSATDPVGTETNEEMAVDGNVTASVGPDRQDGIESDDNPMHEQALFTQPMLDKEHDDQEDEDEEEHKTTDREPSNTETFPVTATPSWRSQQTHHRGSKGGTLLQRPSVVQRRGSNGSRLESVHDLNLDVTLGALPRAKRAWKNVPNSYIEALRDECCAHMLPPLQLTGTAGGYAGSELRAILAAALPVKKKKMRHMTSESVWLNNGTD